MINCTQNTHFIFWNASEFSLMITDHRRTKIMTSGKKKFLKLVSDIFDQIFVFN